MSNPSTCLIHVNADEREALDCGLQTAVALEIRRALSIVAHTGAETSDARVGKKHGRELRELLTCFSNG